VDVLVTIITPTLNRASFLAHAIESVRRQSYRPIQHIIVDGGSTDGTHELLARYPEVERIVGRDEGIYDALNKGLTLAKGEVIGFLNSDDLYLGEVVAAAVSRLMGDPSLDAVCGGARIVSESIEGRRELVHLNDESVKSLNMQDISGPPCIINGRFFRRGVFERIGKFDARFRIAGDQEFLLRACINQLRSISLPDIVYEYRQHPGSMTLNGRKAARLSALRECLDIAARFSSAEQMPAGVRRSCRRWHAWLSGWGTLTALMLGEMRRSTEVAALGMRRDPFWPLLFSTQICSYLKWTKARGPTPD
jgi:glycosyltransferase involved in cell wall biosynthesis